MMILAEYKAEVDRLQWETELLRSELDRKQKEIDWLQKALTNTIRDSQNTVR